MAQSRQNRNNSVGLNWTLGSKVLLLISVPTSLSWYIWHTNGFGKAKWNFRKKIMFCYKWVGVIYNSLGYTRLCQGHSHIAQRHKYTFTGEFILMSITFFPRSRLDCLYGLCIRSNFVFVAAAEKKEIKHLTIAILAHHLSRFKDILWHVGVEVYK